MSMDGNNRTVIIEADTNDTMLSLTLDYQTQVLYWIFGNNSNGSLNIKRSNTDGTNQQTILQLQNIYYYYYNYFHLHRFFYDLIHLFGLTVYNETLFLSLPWMSNNEIYKLETNDINGENFSTLFINSSAQVLCRFPFYQIKVTNQPSG